jgi:tellurite methyltransferase
MSEFYDEKYGGDKSYWGVQPSSMARILFQKFLPAPGDRLLELGSGEGRDAIFFARNGYAVTAFDASEAGVKKSKAWAADLGLAIDFFQADINEYSPQESFNVIFSSGALHYIPPKTREAAISSLKRSTFPGGIHAHMVPIQKPHIPTDPEADALEQDWRSGEILTYYYDWDLEFFAEEVLDDSKSDYKFVVNRIIARQPNRSH